MVADSDRGFGSGYRLLPEKLYHVVGNYYEADRDIQAYAYGALGQRPRHRQMALRVCVRHDVFQPDLHDTRISAGHLFWGAACMAGCSGNGGHLHHLWRQFV